MVFVSVKAAQSEEKGERSNRGLLVGKVSKRLLSHQYLVPVRSIAATVDFSKGVDSWSPAYTVILVVDLLNPWKVPVRSIHTP